MYIERRVKIAWLIACLVVAFLAVEAAAQTGFGLPVEGEKTVALSSKVGENQIVFVSTAPLEDIHGAASGISGTLTLHPNHLETLSGHIQVDVKSMKTGISKRDKHLYSEDWLDANAHPVIAFHIRHLEAVESAGIDTENGRASVKGTAVGDFSLHGVTVEMKIPFEATYILESEQTRQRAPGDFIMVQAAFRIALKDFNIRGAKGIVGKRVGETIDIQAIFFGSTAIGSKEK